jgi:hypothetical protein
MVNAIYRVVLLLVLITVLWVTWQHRRYQAVALGDPFLAVLDTRRGTLTLHTLEKGEPDAYHLDMWVYPPSVHSLR